MKKKYSGVGQSVGRIKLLITYDNSKTLSENEISLFEQPGVIPDWKGNLERQKQQKEEYVKRYTEGCSHPEKAIEPPKTPAGKEGILDCCCYYPAPAVGKDNVGKIEGLYVFRNSELKFWENISDYNSVVENWLNIFRKQGLSVNTESLIKQVSQVFPLGTVRQIKLASGLEYNCWVAHPKNTVNDNLEYLYFIGYFDRTGQPYVPEFIKDDRNSYQKFIDNWGQVILFTTLIVTAIAAVSGVGTIPLWLELVTELSVGFAIGIRDIQKGYDVSGAFSIIMGVLPVLKADKYFKGYNPKQFDELARAFQQSRLSSSSHLSEYVSFYNKLNKPQREILDKILRGGDVQGKSDILQSLTNEVREKLPDLLQDGFNKMWKAKPKLFVPIKTFDRLWVRELSVNLTTGIASYLVNFMYPELSKANKEGMTQEIKDKLDGVYENIPEKYKKEMSHFLMANPEKYEEILNSADFKKAQEISKNYIGKNKNNVSEGLVALYQKTINDITKKQGLQPVSGQEMINSEKMTPKQIIDLKKSGYTELQNLDIKQKFSDLRFINNIYYAKPTTVDTSILK